MAQSGVYLYPFQTLEVVEPLKVIEIYAQPQEVPPSNTNDYMG